MTKSLMVLLSCVLVLTIAFFLTGYIFLDGDEAEQTMQNEEGSPDLAAEVRSSDFERVDDPASTLSGETEVPRQADATIRPPDYEGYDVPSAFLPSQGLVFLSNSDGTCSVVGIGTFAWKHLVIPVHSPDGDLVTEIADDAFASVQTITSLYLPETVKSVGARAFAGSSLEEIDLGCGVEYIGQSAFDSVKISTLSIPESVRTIDPGAFRACSALTDVVFASGDDWTARYSDEWIESNPSYSDVRISITVTSSAENAANLTQTFEHLIWEKN